MPADSKLFIKFRIKGLKGETNLVSDVVSGAGQLTKHGQSKRYYVVPGRALNIDYSVDVKKTVSNLRMRLHSQPKNEHASFVIEDVDVSVQLNKPRDQGIRTVLGYEKRTWWGSRWEEQRYGW